MKRGLQNSQFNAHKLIVSKAAQHVCTPSSSERQKLAGAVPLHLSSVSWKIKGRCQDGKCGELVSL